jgi:CubicO group peptidase (beta-lactamase class C family)
MKNPSPAKLAALAARAKQLQAAAGGLETAVRRVARQNRIVGLSLVLCHPDGRDQFLHMGHARLSPKIPVTQNTCFRVASVSKLVLSFGALALAERGLLSLDEDVCAYLGYSVRSPHAPDAPVTLRMLLTHTASLRDEGSYGTLGMQSGTKLRDLLARADNWLPQRPGESFHYSNFGAGVAGCVMERAADMPLDELMRRYVFTPLGIRASYDPRAIAPADDLADGYSVRGLLPPKRRYDAKVLAARPKESPIPGEDYLCAAGRMITDSQGMAALIRLLASKDGMGVLSPESLALMRAPQDGIGGIANCGRGLNVAYLPGVFPGHDALGHQGVAYGMCAELFADPASGCGVGVMTSGTRLVRQAPLMRTGFDLLALGFAALGN